jgi:hypothetical protein
MNRRDFLVLLGGAVTIPLAARAVAAAPPADFCLRHPNNPKCQPSPTPTPTPTSTTTTPPPTGQVYGPHGGAQFIRDNAWPQTVLA